MHTDSSFKTQTGYCHITEEQIIFSSDGDPENALAKKEKNMQPLRGLFSGIIALSLIAFGIKDVLEQDYWTAGVSVMLGLVVGMRIIYSMNNATIPVIDRCRIDLVEFKPALPGAKRAYFKVYFFDEDNKRKRKMILMPGTLTGGVAETEHALHIMRREFPDLKVSGWN